MREKIIAHLDVKPASNERKSKCDDFMYDLSKSFIENGYDPVEGFEHARHEMSMPEVDSQRFVRHQSGVEYGFDDMLAHESSEHKPRQEGWLQRKLGNVGTKLASGVREWWQYQVGCYEDYTKSMDEVAVKSESQPNVDAPTQEEIDKRRRNIAGALGFTALLASAALILKDNPHLLSNAQ